MDSVGLRLEPQGSVAVHLAADGTWTMVDASDEAALQALAARVGGRIGAAFTARMYNRELRLPFRQAGKVREALPLLLDDRVPGKIEDYTRLIGISDADDGSVASALLLHNDDVAAARARLATLPEPPRILEPEPLLMYGAADRGPPGHAFVWIGERTTGVVVTPTEGPRYFFSVPIGADHLDAPMAPANLRIRLFAGLRRPVDRWIVDGFGTRSDPLRAAFAGLPAARIVEWIAPDAGDPEEPALRVALAAARAVARHTKPLWNTAPRRRLLSSRALQNPLLRSLVPPVAMAIVLALVAFGAGTAAVRAQADAQRAELAAIYERNFPGGRIIDPLRQMRAIVERAAAPAAVPAGGPVIDRLRDLSSAVSGPTRIVFDELRLANGDWIVKGDAPDFAAVDHLKEAIAGLPWVNEVKVQRAEQNVDQTAIRFQINWSEKAAQP